MVETIRLLDHDKIKKSDYKNQFVGCLVLTKNRKILLQKRGKGFAAYPDYLCEFGGKRKEDEQPINAIIRELKEELGAIVKEDQIIFLGAITEKMSNYSELVHTYFWHDVDNTITGCYEGEARYFNDIASILAHPRITDGLRWMLSECQKRKLLI